MGMLHIKVVGLVAAASNGMTGPQFRKALEGEAASVHRLVVCGPRGCTTIDDFADRERAIELGMKIGNLAMQPGAGENWAEDLTALVCTVFDVPTECLRSADRKQPLARSRHAASFLARRMRTDHSNGLIPLTEIGQKLTGRDHTTVMHSIRAAEILLERRNRSERMFFRQIGRTKRTLEAIGYGFVEGEV
jgi:hypothetical protein